MLRASSRSNPCRVDDRYGRRDIGGITRRPRAYDSDGLQPIVVLVARIIVALVFGHDRHRAESGGRSRE